MCKCNAGGRGIPAVLPCSTTANQSLADDGFKMMFNKKPAWLRADLTGNRFNIPHSTCTNPTVKGIIKTQNIHKNNSVNNLKMLSFKITLYHE
jgi:hypothetical protein